MAPERLRAGFPPLRADHPESRLRQAVFLRLREGTPVEAAVGQLRATGLFRDVQVARTPAPIRFAQTNTEPLASEPPSGDPHRWQWALPAIRAPGSTGAWHLTRGRSQVASLDGGIVPSHPDVMAGQLSNFRLHVSGGWSGGVLSPDFLNDTSADFGPFVNHGTHVNTLLAAPINNAGIAGVCPTCTLQTFRWTGGDVLADSALFSGRFGSTALNMSFEPFNPGSGPQTLFEPALRMMDDRDVVQIAAAGNRAAPRTGWASLGVPHRLDWVLKVAASDRDNGYWDELRLLTLPAQRRHPVKTLANACSTPGTPSCIWGVIASRCQLSPLGDPTEQCRSNWGAPGVTTLIDLAAPGVQVVAGLVPSGVYSPVPPDPLNVEAYPPARSHLGVDQFGVQVLNASTPAHGPMTGTSMAAPHVTATAGLMRSINPLLSSNAVRAGLKSRANSDPLVVPGYSAERMGAGLLDARHAVENAAGRVHGVYLRNRLAPVFSMFADVTQVASEAKEGEFFGSNPINAWLFTTNPSLASAAMAGDIYVTDVASFSPTQFAAYRHAFDLPDPLRNVGIPIAASVYQLPVGAGKRPNPSASFYVFTTPNAVPGVSTPLIPLYRLTTHHGTTCAAEQRKHLYTTRESEALGFINGVALCGAPAYSMGYRFESIEGYVYDRAQPNPQPDLLVPLYRGYHPTLNTTALIVGNERCTRAFNGYALDPTTSASNNDFLGWVYPTFAANACAAGAVNVPPSTTALDADSDGLPDGVEIALALNEQSADGDCDGVSDAIEYGFANLPDDPMSPSAGCTDGRINAVYNAGLQTVTVTLSNPIGPVALPAGTKAIVYFTGVPHPPITLMGGGGSQCQSIATIGWDAAYECTLSSALPVGSTSTVAWQWTNVGGPLFQPGQNVAEITATPGLGDPVLANNSRSF